MLYFQCPSCNANCETTPAFAGKSVYCPHCGKSVHVPADSALTSTPPAPKPKPAPAATAITTPDLVPQRSAAAPAPDISQPAGNPLRNLVLVVGGIAILVFLALWLMPPESGKPAIAGGSSSGTIKIELYPEKAPVTVANFLRYVDDKHYDGTIFHRVISDFMIQGGGFEPGMKPKSSKYPPIKNEAKNGLSNKRGTIAMARTNDPDSATDQFFINVEENGRKLDPGGFSPDGYAAFGKVIDGMDFVDAIKAVKVLPSPNGEMATPAKNVIIQSIRRDESAKSKNPVVVMEVSWN